MFIYTLYYILSKVPEPQSEDLEMTEVFTAILHTIVTYCHMKQSILFSI